MKCHTLSCMNGAKAGSTFCEACKPSKATSLEDAQVRVAKAEDAKTALHEQIMKKHGSIAELDAACREEKSKQGSMATYNGQAHKLRSKYNAATKELRLAKSDLARMRNEAEQKGASKAKAEASAPEDEGGAFDNHPTYEELLEQYKALCKEIEDLGPNYSGKMTPEEAKLKKKRLGLRKILKTMAPLRTCWFCSGFSINNYQSPCREGALPIGGVPKDACDCWGIAHGAGYLEDWCTKAQEDLKDGGTGKVVEVLPNGDAAIELTPAAPDGPKARCVVCKKECYTLDALMEHIRQEHPEPEEAEVLVQVNGGPAHPMGSPEASEAVGSVMQHIAERIVEAEEARKQRPKQLDPNGEPVMLAPGLKETEKIRRSRLYEHDKYKLQITEDDLAGLWIFTRSKARTTIARKLKLQPDEDLFEGEWDEEVDYLLDELTKVSRQVWNERNAASGIRAGVA